jgi:alkanesulfonate monooxygenase SsuD/methylene tetrahydromethanopterin reductase-like flavin-dependent oxidoreductase (luciferase family)
MGTRGTSAARIAGVQIFLFLPQMRLSMEAIVERAVAAESVGFTGIAFIDHLAPPMAEAQPMHDAMVTAAWVAAHTSTLRVGHLVLCDGFRHPAVLAKQVVSLDHVSGGRFDLGIGWGSVPEEFATFGVNSDDASARVERLGETLDVLRSLWSGRPVSYDGVHHHLTDACTNPTPLGDIPIVIGGVGRKTLALVAAHADWWNVPVHRLDALDSMRDQAGSAKLSVQVMVSFVPPGGDPEAIHGAATRRFSHAARSGAMVVGDADQVAEAFRGFADRGVERVYAWFADFAPPETLQAFAPVIAATA